MNYPQVYMNMKLKEEKRDEGIWWRRSRGQGKC